MKQIVAILLAAAMALTPAVARAVAGESLSDGQIEYIRNNCADTQIALRRVQSTDALAYVNLYQQYDTIARRLMAPMNSRAALNNLNTAALAKTAADYNTAITNFKTAYAQYKQTLDGALAMNCYNQPVEFYDTLASLLDQRTKLRAATGGLGALLAQYRSQVVELQSKVPGAKT